MARNRHLTWRDAVCTMPHGRLHSVTIALLDSDEYVEAMSNATLPADRDACDWPELRREILANGGIGPSPDWPRDWYPGDLFRVNGRAPDLVAAETFLGTADRAPWQSGDLAGDDSAMFAYLRASFNVWQHVQERERAQVQHRAPKPAPAVIRKPGTRSFAEFVRDLREKHGADVDLSGLRSEYVSAYECGERVTLKRDGRTYRGTVGATRGARPRFVLLLSMDL